MQKPQPAAPDLGAGGTPSAASDGSATLGAQGRRQQRGEIKTLYPGKKGARHLSTFHRGLRLRLQRGSASARSLADVADE